MMDKKYILAHGILEQYVLGELSTSQQQQVEKALLTDAELQKRLYEVELSFEQLAFDNAMDVPPDVKLSLLGDISKSNVKNAIYQPFNRSYIAIAAAVAALFSIGLIYMYSEMQSVKEQLQVVEQENQNLKNSMQTLNASLDETTKRYAVINNPETEKYVLRGNDRMPDATIIGYVNDVTKTVIVNTEKLPNLDDQHDYQMWADVEGVMINMGLLKEGEDMLAMTYIENAESLNITIEPIGGSDHPNVAQLVTSVYLK